MELVYLWVEEYKNIKEQGFNFSPRFDCKFYDEYENGKEKLKDNCKLEIKPKEYTSIFPPNINITAIVGENGSGKSRLLEILNIQQHSIDAKCFFIYRAKNGQYNALIYNMNIDKIDCIKTLFTQSISILTTKDGCTCYNNGDDIEKKLEQTLNTFTYNLRNTSTKSDSFISTKSEDVFLSILKNKHFSNQKISSFFEKIKQVKIKENKDYIEELKGKITALGGTRNFNSALELEMYWTIVSDTKIKEEFHTKLEPYKERNHYESIKNTLQNTYDDLIKTFTNNQNINYRISEYHTVYNPEYNPNNSYNVIDYNKLDSRVKENIIKYKKFFTIDFFDMTGKSFDDLSTGEQELFAQLYNINEKIENSKVDNIVFLFDEPANNFHPKWQKEYIYELHHLLSNYPNKNFQVMITTHFPFLLSDLPKENVIFLEKGKQVYPFENGQTFGANIHTLLSDGFFMSGGLMGEFAKSKIDEVIALLNKDKLSKSELKHCEQIISIIGEPIIKNQLQRMLNSKRLKKVDKIDKIEQEIRRLKQSLKELQDDKKSDIQ